jgi:hypothetical protein
MSASPFSDEHIIAQAQGCQTYAQLWHKLPEWTDFRAVARAADRLNLGLTYVRKSTGAPREAQSVPKPVGKGAKPKPKGGGDG